MQLQSQLTQQTDQEVQEVRISVERKPERTTSHLTNVSLAAGVFVVALALRLAFNFAGDHYNAFAIGDAAEYLRNAQVLCTFSQHAGAADYAQLKCLGMSGPIFPGFLAACHLISGAPVTAENWAIAVVPQCIVSALTSVLIMLTAWTAYNRKTAIAAGIFAAFYPAFIVNSGRLCSETLAAFLLAAISLLVVRGFCASAADKGPSLLSVFVTGALTAALQLTRSALIVVSPLVVAAAFYQRSRKKLPAAIVAMVLGFASILMPWATVQKLATGVASPFVDRVGNYNFYTGNSTDGLGWLSFPYPDSHGMNEKSLLQLGKEAIAPSPVRWLRLMQDKPSRLFKFPWNDFRVSIGPVDFQMQVFAHQLLVLLAALGICLTLGATAGAGTATAGSSSHRGARALFLARLFLLTVVALHLPYFLFITLPRYNLTAMPALLVFAAAGAVCLYNLVTNRATRATGLFVLSGALLFFCAQQINWFAITETVLLGKHTNLSLVLVALLKAGTVLAFGFALWKAAAFQAGYKVASRALIIFMAIGTLAVATIPVRANGRCFEWTCPLKDGSTVTQTIILDPGVRQTLPGRQAFIAVDTNGASDLSNLAVSVNGKPLDVAGIPVMSLHQYCGSWVNSSPQIILRECEWIFDCLAKPASTSNRELRQWFLLPVPLDTMRAGLQTGKLDVVITARGPATLYGAYPTRKTHVHLPDFTYYSWEKAFYGVESDSGLGDARYDTQVETTAVAPRYTDLSGEAGAQTGAYNVRLFVGSNLELTHNKIVPTEADQAFALQSEQKQATVAVAEPLTLSFKDFPKGNGHEVWVLRVTGVASGKQPTHMNVAVSANMPATRYDSPWGGRAIAVTTTPKPFDIAVPLNSAPLPANLQSIESVITTDQPIEIRNLRAQLVKLPCNPLWGGHHIW